MAGAAGAIVGGGIGLLKSMEKQRQDQLRNEGIVGQARSSMYKTLINKKFTGAPIEDITMSGNVEDVAKGAAGGATGGFGGGKGGGLASLFSGLSKSKKKEVTAGAGTEETAMA